MVDVTRFSFSGHSGGFGRERQFDGEACAVAGAAVGADCAAVLLDDLFGDGEAEARALLLGGEERLEDARAGLVVHAGAAVFDLDARGGRRFAGYAVVPVADGERGALGLDDEGGFGGAGVEGVGEEVDEDLAELVGVPVAAQAFGGETTFERRALLADLVGDEFEALIEQLREVNFGERELAAARELRHVERELGEVLDAALDEVYGVDGLLVLRHDAEHGDAEADAAQGIFYLVRDRGRRAPDRRQRLLTPQVLLGLSRLRHVNEREELAGLALDLQRRRVNVEGALARVPFDRHAEAPAVDRLFDARRGRGDEELEAVGRGELAVDLLA